eukprot:maker-scaffold_8-snap-gene-12.55-mRNA-1 protein AED:0.01 eAED:0.01 QI:347/1/1/1/1/1/2/250/373
MSLLKKILSRNKNSSKAKNSALDAFNKQYILTDKVLGAGSYAEVRLGRDRKSNAVVAVKIIDKTELSEREKKGLHKEVDILKSLNHQNVVRFYDYFEEENVMYICMEYCSGGELYEKVVRKDYTEGDVQRIIRKLALGLKYCKEKGVIHRDLKPQNLLLTETGDKGELKLADFNLSIKIDKDQAEFSLLQTMCGTPNYVSPEVLSQKPYSYKCDIWSLGVIAYLLLSGGHLPFHVDEEGELGKNLLLEKVRQGRWGFFPEESWRSVSDEAKDFLKRVMQPRPERRANYDQILNHVWLKGGENDVVIDSKDFQMSHFRRKMLAAGKAHQAIDVFNHLANVHKFDTAEQNREKQEFQTSFLSSLGQSSTEFPLVE